MRTKFPINLAFGPKTEFWLENHKPPTVISGSDFTFYPGEGTMTKEEFSKMKAELEA